MRLDELESALREAADAQPPVSPPATAEIVQRVRRRRRRQVLVAVAIVALAAPVAATMRESSSPTRTVVAGPSTDEPRAWPPDPVRAERSRHEVMEWVRQRTDGRIDRLEAKLVTWGEYAGVRPEPPGRDGVVSSDTLVWVVVVAGDLRASRPGLGIGRGFKWGVWVLRADDGTTVVSELTGVDAAAPEVTSAAGEVTLPSWYRRLVDRGGDAEVTGAPSDHRAVDVCEKARVHERNRLLAAYDSTVGEVRAWLDSRTTGGPSAGLERWPGRPADERVAVCWFDGRIAKSPPPSPSGEPRPPFDRFVLIVGEQGDSELAMAGYRDNLVPAPPR